MDCSCDLKDLKKVLKNDKDAHKFGWKTIEDIAILSEQELDKDQETIGKGGGFLGYEN